MSTHSEPQSRAESVIEPDEETGIAPGPRLAVYYQRLRQSCAEFDISNSLERGNLSVLINAMVKLLNTADPGLFGSSWATLDSIDTVLRDFAVTQFHKLQSHTYYTRAFQSAGTRPERRMTTRERYELILKQRQIQQKYNFTPAPTSVNGVGDDDLLDDHVASYAPSELDLKSMNRTMVEQRREELFKWTQRSRMMNEDRVSMSDKVWALWFSVKAMQGHFVAPKIKTTVGDLVGMLPDLKTSLKQLGVNEEKFKMQPDYLMAPRSIMYSVDPLTPDELKTPIMQCSLDTALHILQILGALMWWLPLWDADFEKRIGCLEFRLAHLVTNAESHEVMNAIGMYGRLQGTDGISKKKRKYKDEFEAMLDGADYWEEEEEEDPHFDMDFAFSRESQQKLRQSQPRFVSLYTSRAIFACLRGLWYLMSRAVTYAESQMPVPHEEDERCVETFMKVASTQFKMSEQQTKDMHNDMTSSYITMGVHYLYSIKYSALPKEDRLVVPHTWGSKVFTLIRQHFSRPGDVIVDDMNVAPHLRAIACLHILNGYFNKSGFDGFLEKYIIFSDVEAMDTLLRVGKTSQTEPKFIQVANQFMVLFRGTVFRCNNDPMRLIRTFFVIVADECNRSMDGVPIDNILVEMGVIQGHPGSSSSMPIGNKKQILEAMKKMNPKAFASRK
jgi:hypothetical protein